MYMYQYWYMYIVARCPCTESTASVDISASTPPFSGVTKGNAARVR